MRQPSWPLPIHHTFETVVNSFPLDILSPTGKERAKSIWDECNAALYNAGARFGDDDVWETLHGREAVASAFIRLGRIKE